MFWPIINKESEITAPPEQALFVQDTEVFILTRTEVMAKNVFWTFLVALTLTFPSSYYTYLEDMLVSITGWKMKNVAEIEKLVEMIEIWQS